jgi:hypothetical protein
MARPSGAGESRTQIAARRRRSEMDSITAGAVMMTARVDVVHRFAAGHVVRLGRTTPFHNAAAGNYAVVAQLPERDGELQYCIKSDREPYERIVKEDEIETA